MFNCLYQLGCFMLHTLVVPLSYQKIVRCLEWNLSCLVGQRAAELPVLKVCLNPKVKKSLKPVKNLRVWPNFRCFFHFASCHLHKIMFQTSHLKVHMSTLRQLRTLLWFLYIAIFFCCPGEACRGYILSNVLWIELKCQKSARNWSDMKSFLVGVILLQCLCLH